MSKICGRCLREYICPEKDFYKNSLNKDGYERYCKECSRNWNKLQYQANREKRIEYSKTYQSKHYQKKTRSNDIGNMQETGYKFCSKCNQEFPKTTEYFFMCGKRFDSRCKKCFYEYNKRRRNTSTYKEWAILNRKTENYKASKRIKDARRRSQKKGLISIYSKDNWSQCKAAFDNKCAYCGKEAPLTQDHFVALVNGGEYTTNNIVSVCQSCNSRKGTSNFFGWYPKQEFYSKRREQKILKYLNYDSKTKTQQLALSI